MKDQRNEAANRKAGFAAGLAAAVVLCSVGNVMPADAAETLTVSSKEYNLTVEDLPEGVDKAYAKFHDESLNAGNYILSLFDGYDAMIAMEEALIAAGEDLAFIEYQAIEATVYEMDEEGDYYPLDEMKGITLICPLPESFAKNADRVQVTAVDAAGALCRIDSKIVKVDQKECVMFDLSVFTTYALLYKSSGTLTSGKHPTPTPVPTKAAEKTPTAAPTKTAEKTPTPAPTKTAGKTPTAAPTKTAEKTPTPKPKAALKESVTPAPAKAADKTPTKEPAKAGAVASGTSASSTVQRDKTPQTGDSFSAGRYLAMLAAGGTLAGLSVWLGRRKK